jgi:ATP-dependent protease ClpP protease subunit
MTNYAHPFTSECGLLRSYEQTPRACIAPSPAMVANAERQVQAFGGAACVFLQAAITDTRTANGITATYFCSFLDAAREAGAKSLLLHVTSEGGVATEALAMFRALRRFSDEVGPVVAYVDRLAGSGASLAALAADFVVIAPEGRFFVHEPQGGPDDTRAHLRNSLERIYAERTLAPADQLAAFMAGAVHIDSRVAVTYGFADEVGGNERAVAVAKQAASAGGLYGANIAAGADGSPLAYASWRQRVLNEREAHRKGAGSRP